MNRSKELAKNTVILTIGKMCTQFVSFMLLPLYTTLLSTEEYGVVDLLITYISLLLPLVCWQLDQGIFRFMLDIRDDNNKIKSLFSSILALNFFQSLIFVLLFYILTPFFFISEYKIYLLLGVVLNVLSSLLMQFARGLRKMFHYSVASFLTAVSTVCLNVLFVAVFKMGANGIFIATMCGIGINCVYLIIALGAWKYIDIKGINIKLIIDVCKYSAPLIPNQISGWILSASDRTIVSQFISIAANGVYSVANKFSNLVGTFYGFFNLAWVETVSVHYNDEDRDSFISEMIETVLNIFVSVCVCIIAIMPFVFPIMVNSKYEDAYYQIPILLVAVIFQILVGLYSAIYIALKKSVTIARTTIAGAIINVVVNIALIRFIGLYAASISTLVSYACVALYRKVDVKKYVNINLNKRNVISNIIMVITVTIGYYINLNFTNIILFVLAVIYALFINRDVIILLIEEIKKYMHHN